MKKLEPFFRAAKSALITVGYFLTALLADPTAPTPQAGALNVAAACLLWASMAGRLSAWPLVAVLALYVANNGIHAWAEVTIERKDVPKRPK